MGCTPGLVLLAIVLIHTGESGAISPEIEAGCVMTPAFQSLGNLGRYRYYYSATPLSWPDANKTCRTYRDTYIATIPDAQTKDFIVQKAGPIDRAWFGAQELKFNRWTWLNNQVFYGEMKVYVTHDKNTCGFVDRGSNQFGMSPCYVNKRFLCVNPAADPGDLKPADYYISSVLEKVTWFRAREACLCRDLDLAVAKGNYTGFISDLLEGDTDHFWIGLQKTRYIWERTGEPITYLPFENNQPNNYLAKQDCLDLNGDLFSDNDCTKKLPFICVWENTTAEADKQEQAKPLGVRDKDGQRAEDGGVGLGLTAGLGWVLMVVVLVILIVVVVFFVLRTRAGKRSGNWWRFENSEAVSG